MTPLLEVEEICILLTQKSIGKNTHLGSPRCYSSEQKPGAAKPLHENEKHSSVANC